MQCVTCFPFSYAQNGALWQVSNALLKREARYYGGRRTLFKEDRARRENTLSTLPSINKVKEQRCNETNIHASSQTDLWQVTHVVAKTILKLQHSSKSPVLCKSGVEMALEMQCIANTYTLLPFLLCYSFF